MERIQQVISQQNIWMRALILVLAMSLILFAIGLLMGKLRHLVIEGALRHLLGAKAAIIVGYYLTIIGTLHHELAHALGYLLTGGRVHRISIIPRAQPDGTIRLGYVDLKILLHGLLPTLLLLYLVLVVVLLIRK